MDESDRNKVKGPGKQESRPTASYSGTVPGPGYQIAHFQIEHELGRGGMGIVYLAHDTKLKRSVAIKSLPPEVMRSSQIRSRLDREARLLASLNHPNIAAIYDEIEEAEGVRRRQEINYTTTSFLA